jgi:hypothetical protein
VVHGRSRDPHLFPRRDAGNEAAGALAARQGRDLYDLAHAQETFDDLDADRIAMLFGRYLELSGQTISRAQAQERMLAKLANPRFLTDMRPLLPADAAERMTEAATADSFRRVFTTFVDRLPGEPWGRLSEIKERFGITW